MKLIKVRHVHSNVYKVILEDDKGVEYIMHFNDGQPFGAKKALSDEAYRGLKSVTHRHVKGPKAVWDFAKNQLDKFLESQS
ncbi:hypothetical protein [Vibrio owensii]|uniref:hypothetical protein n=1 Tax=Vibrio owensii TaxID=696485 RepID=UPI003CC54D08